MKKYMQCNVVFGVFMMLFFGQLYGQQKITNLTLSFSNACATATYNHGKFWVDFGWEGALADDDNEFIVELSSATGDFSSPTQLATFKGRGRDGNVSSNPNITRITFGFPTNVGGTGYKIRVRSTDPEIQAESNTVVIFYMAVTSRLAIEGASQIDLCKGQTQILSADNKSAALYKWYKDGVVIPNEKKSSLEVSQTGRYEVEVDYTGSSCSSTTKSTAVTVTVIDETGLPPVSIENGNVKLCNGATHVLSADVKHSSGYKYIWYKDGVKQIEGEGLFNYTVSASDVPATFYVEYSKMGTLCEFTQRSDEVALSKYEGEDFEMTLQNKTVEETYSGGVVPLRVEISPRTVETTIKWYKDGLLLAETGKEMNATEAGKYKVEVSSKADCPDLVVTKSAEVQVKVVEIEKIPNLVIRDSQETLNRKWIIPEKYKNLQTQITIYSQTGEKIFDGTNYRDEFPAGEAQPENKGRSQIYFYIIKVNGEESKQGTITVLN